MQCVQRKASALGQQ